MDSEKRPIDGQEIRKKRKKRRVSKQLEQPNFMPDSEEVKLVEKDGEEVYRVKKKGGRRSSQRKHEAEKEASRKLLRFLLTIAGLTIFSAITAVVLLVRANSSSFEERVEAGLGKKYAGKAEIAGLAVSPTSVSISSLVFEGEDGSLIKEASLDEIVGTHHVMGLLGGTWSGPELTAKHAKILVNMNGAIGNGEIDPKVDFTSYRADESILHFLFGKNALSFENGRVSCRETDLSIYDADVELLGLGKVKAKSAVLEFTEKKPLKLQLEDEVGEVTHLTGAALGSSLELSGAASNVNFKNVCSELSQLLLGYGEVNDVSLSIDSSGTAFEGTWKQGQFNIFLPGLSELLNRIGAGGFDASAFDKEKEPKEAKDNESKKDGTLKKRRSTLLSDQAGLKFGRLLYKGQVKASRNGKGVEQVELDLVSGRGIIVRGTLGGIQGGKGSASLQIGIPVRWRKQLESDPELMAIFTKSDEDYFWTNLSASVVGGVAKDDLQSRLHGAKFDQIDAELKKKLEEQLQNLLNGS